jgi:hypothetical protein
MEMLLLEQGKPCNRNNKSMVPMQGNPCSLNRFSPCNLCFCFDFHYFFYFYRVLWTGISLCILQLFYVTTTELEGLLWYPVIFTGSLQGRITTQGDPCNLYREGVCSVVNPPECKLAKRTSVVCNHRVCSYIEESWKVLCSYCGLFLKNSYLIFKTKTYGFHTFKLWNLVLTQTLQNLKTNLPMKTLKKYPKK